MSHVPDFRIATLRELFDSDFILMLIGRNEDSEGWQTLQSVYDDGVRKKKATRRGVSGNGMAR